MHKSFTSQGREVTVSVPGNDDGPRLSLSPLGKRALAETLFACGLENDPIGPWFDMVETELNMTAPGECRRIELGVLNNYGEAAYFDGNNLEMIRMA